MKETDKKRQTFYLTTANYNLLNGLHKITKTPVKILINEILQKYFNELEPETKKRALDYMEQKEKLQKMIV